MSTHPPPLQSHPSATTDLRVGETVSLEASATDTTGQPIPLALPAWGLEVGAGAVTIDSPSDYVCEITAVGPAGGSDAVSFSYVDSIEVMRTETIPTHVLDAAVLVPRIVSTTGCMVSGHRDRNGTIYHVRPSNGASTMVLRADAYDARGFTGDYALSDGPSWSSDNGLVRFDGATTDTDDPETTVTFHGYGNEVIRVTGTADESGDRHQWCLGSEDHRRRSGQLRVRFRQVTQLDLWRSVRAADLTYSSELRRAFGSRANRFRGLHPTVYSHLDLRLSKAALDYRRSLLAWRYGKPVRKRISHDSGLREAA